MKMRDLYEKFIKKINRLLKPFHLHIYTREDDEFMDRLLRACFSSEKKQTELTKQKQENNQ